MKRVFCILLTLLVLVAGSGLSETSEKQVGLFEVDQLLTVSEEWFGANISAIEKSILVAEY